MKKHILGKELVSARQYQGQVHPTPKPHTQWRWNSDEIQKHWAKAESKVWPQWDVMVEKIIFDLRDTWGKILTSSLPAV